MRTKDVGLAGLAIEGAALIGIAGILVGVLREHGYTQADFGQNSVLLVRALGEIVDGSGPFYAVADFPFRLFLSDAWMDWLRGQTFVLLLVSLVGSFYSSSPVEVGLKLLVLGTKSYDRLPQRGWIDVARFLLMPVGVLVLGLMAVNPLWLAGSIAVMLILEGEAGQQSLWRTFLYAVMLQAGLMIFAW